MASLMEKVAKIAAKEGLSINAMEKMIGASKGVLGRAISQNSDIQAKWVIIIAQKFPKYSAEWLLRDEEPMLRTAASATNITTANGNDAVSVGTNHGTTVLVSRAKKAQENSTDTTTLLAAKDEVIRTQQDMIATQKALIDILQKHQK